jgi:hypothetical protein
VIRTLVCIGVIAGATAFGQRPASPIECDDKVAECKEDCAITFGGTTNLKARGKLTACANKCSRAEQDCRETFFETRRNNLDEGAISGSPSSRDVDDDGLPTKTAQKKPEAKPAPKVEEDLRDDRARAEPAAEKKKAEPKPAELKPEEVPKSNRSQITKVDDKGEKPKAEPAPEPKAEPAPVREREEPKKAEEPPPPPPKKTEKREEPKKKEEKRRALDEWDPDAL